MLLAEPSYLPALSACSNSRLLRIGALGPERLQRWVLVDLQLNFVQCVILPRSGPAEVPSGVRNPETVNALQGGASSKIRPRFIGQSSGWYQPGSVQVALTSTAYWRVNIRLGRWSFQL